MTEDSVLLRTHADSDFAEAKPHSEVIFAAQKYLLQYLGQNKTICLSIYLSIYLSLSLYIYIYYIHIYGIHFELRFFDFIKKVGPSWIRIHDLVLSVYTL